MDGSTFPTPTPPTHLQTARAILALHHFPATLPESEFPRAFALILRHAEDLDALADQAATETSARNFRAAAEIARRDYAAVLS